MLPASVQHLEESVAGDASVLDVGGWAKPLERADWVIDLMPYETRGSYGRSEPERERFSAGTWVQRDLCDREPFPFADEQFDFCVCSHTLEDLRDPVWVCAEMARVSRAGYIEVPSRLEEQAFGVQGPWVGWSHHHWLIDVTDGQIEFIFKPGVLQGRADCQFPAGFAEGLTAQERSQTLWWDGDFSYGERIFYEPGELDAYLSEFVGRHRGAGRGRESKRRWGR